MSFRKLDAALSEEVVGEVIKHIEAAVAILADSITTLSPKDRQRLAKLSPKAVDFLQKSLGWAEQSPQFLPAYLTAPEFRAEVDLIDKLRRISAPVKAFHKQVTDSVMQAEAGAYSSARIYYDTVKNSAAEGMGGADRIAKELGESYMKQYTFKKKKGGDTPEEETAEQT